MTSFCDEYRSLGSGPVVINGAAVAESWEDAKMTELVELILGG